MQPKTNKQVQFILADVEALLQRGRPRKRPMKPRAEVKTVLGAEISWQSYCKGAWSAAKTYNLPTAFKVAQRTYGFSDHARRQAEKAYLKAAVDHGLYSFADDGPTLKFIDEHVNDTRELIRVASAARKGR